MSKLLQNAKITFDIILIHIYISVIHVMHAFTNFDNLVESQTNPSKRDFYKLT